MMLSPTSPCIHVMQPNLLHRSMQHHRMHEKMESGDSKSDHLGNNLQRGNKVVIQSLIIWATIYSEAINSLLLVVD